MSGLFPYREHTDPWFRIGRLEVTTTILVVLLVGASIIPWVILNPVWTGLTAFTPALVASGQLWRLVTWPFAEGLSLWSLLSLFMLWYFGTPLEGHIGRAKMATLFAGMWATLTAMYSLTALLLSTNSALVGIGLIQFLILLLWIAEYPTVRFLFNIPAWAFGAVILGLQILLLIAGRAFADLLAFLLTLAFVAILARRVGLLTNYGWIPGSHRNRPHKTKVSRAETKANERRASDQERMDALLDQIAESGLHSLSDAQRRELKKLSDRRRKH